MKNLILAILSVFIITSCNGSSSQNNQGHRPPNMDPEKMSEMQTAQMVKELGLNDEQAAKVGEINLKFAKEMKEMMGEPGSQQERPSREKMQEVMKQRNDELKSILSDEQFETMLKNSKERMHHGPGGPGGPGGQGGPGAPEGDPQ